MPSPQDCDDDDGPIRERDGSIDGIARLDALDLAAIAIAVEGDSDVSNAGAFERSKNRGFIGGA